MERFRARFGGDAVAVLLLLLLCAAFLIDDITLPAEYAVSDMVSFFAPFYAFLGAGLRRFDIIGWNPHQFSGAPFAADPESGWMYLPVMLISTLIPAGAAAYLVHAFVHLAIASIGAYVLARMLGLNRTGSFAAAAATVLSQVLNQTACCPPLAQVPAWLPWLLIGAELALRAPSLAVRFGGWAISAIAISQILAAWLGQGAYYALLLLAAWLGWRTLFVPAAPARPLPSRLAGTALDGAAMALLGAGLAAAGLLPRLAFNAVSTIPGGNYPPDPNRALATWSLANAANLLISGYATAPRWYLGGAVLVLALAALLIARRWAHTPFLAATSLVVIILSFNTVTPLHRLMYALLPRFELIHTHSPERIMILAPLLIGLLAGAAITWLPRWTGSRVLLAAAALLPLLAAILINRLASAPDPLISRTTIIIIAATSALLLVAAGALASLPCSSLALRIVPISLIVLIIWDPAASTLTARLAGLRLGSEAVTDLDAHLRRTPAAAFIASQTESDPGRYFGFDPRRLPEPGDQTWGYLRRADDAEGLLVNNRATALGIDDLQGYNPIHLRRYAEYIDALNGLPQDYHETSILPSGLSSPLLDMLGARYIIIPSDTRRPDLDGLRDRLPLVFADQFVDVLERPSAMPRAWLVHDAREVPRGETLPLLASGAVDPRRTALLESPPPPLAQPPDGVAESARYTSREPDRLALHVEAAAPALLVLAEIYDAGWSATVDGVPVPVLAADHALRALPVPAGAHDIILRYDPPGLRTGLIITIGSALAMIAAAAVLLLRRRIAPPAGARA